jgi:hypothetical protein
MSSPSPIDALIAGLESRLAVLAEEARTYPGPIARCDDQLPALLERRAAVAAALQRARELREILQRIEA